MLQPTKVESWPHVEQTGESPAVLKAPQAADHLAEEVCTDIYLCEPQIHYKTLIACLLLTQGKNRLWCYSYTFIF